MTINITAKNIVMMLGFLFFTFFCYEGYQIWNYLFAKVGNAANGQAVSRSQLLDQILGERFATKDSDRNGTQPAQ